VSKLVKIEHTDDGINIYEATSEELKEWLVKTAWPISLTADERIQQLETLVHQLQMEIAELRQMMKSHLRDHELSDYAYGER